MERQEPNTPPNVGAAEDALRRLEERLARASEAAERLIAEAAGSARAAASAGVAPSWSPGSGAESGSDDAGAGHPGAGAGHPGAGDAGAADAGAAGAADAGAAGATDAGAADAGAADAGAADAGAADARRPPPAGWQIPPAEEDRGRTGELELLIQFFQSVRDIIPPDLQRRLGEALRELLLAIRALIDWYLERNEQRRAGGGEVQDIPIL
jgi:hypothetical protein